MDSKTREASSRKRNQGSVQRRSAGKIFGWLAAVLVVLAIGVPTALLFGAGDAIFESPKEGIITFFGTLVFVVVLLVVGYLWEQYKERRAKQQSKHHS